MMPGQPPGRPFERERIEPSGGQRPVEWPVDLSSADGQPSPDATVIDPRRRAARGGAPARNGRNDRNGAHDQPVQPPTSPRWPADERPPWEDDGAAYDQWEWEPALNESIPGGASESLAGTGKLSAVMPLRPGQSAWDRGISAPMPPQAGRSSARAAVPSGIEVDAQPSTRLRALRPGNLARATVIVSGAILVSRILGLLRTSLFAYVIGNGRDADAFTYAFTLPDTIFNIMAGGALASAFIPVFTDYMVDRNDRRGAWHVASAALNVSTLALIVMAAICIALASPIMHLLTPDFFTGSRPLGPEIVMLTQVMLLQPIFLGAATLGVSVLQARQRFLLPAIGQVIYTVSLIGGILATLLDRQTHIFGGRLTGSNAILGPTWGVVAGAALQFVILLPGLSSEKMQYRLTFDIFHPGVRHMFQLMLPRIFNAAASYAAILVTTSWLSSIDPNDTQGYGYRTAFTLMLLPLGLFGMAVAQASFPTLAALVSDRQWERLRTTVLTTLRGMLYLAVPSALGLAVLADPISRLILAHGHFNLTYLPEVVVPLIYFSFALVGLAADEILVRTFYALHDSRTPVYVNICNLMFVLGLSYILLQPLKAGGLALAFALGALGEAPVLALLLSPRIGGLDLKRLGIFLLNVLAASLVTALSALFVYTLLQMVLHVSGTGPVPTFYLAVELGLSIIVAVGVYYAFSKFLGIDDALPLERMLGRVLRLGKAGR